MKRAGFTMIELIFVIVILGILAAVAIPKLAATRSDAEVAKMASAASTAVSELGAYYTSQGSFGTVAQMSNVQLESSAGTYGGTTDLGSANSVLLTDGTNTCLTFETTTTGLVDGNITVSAPPSPIGAICIGVKAATADLQKTHSFGGSNVNW